MTSAHPRPPDVEALETRRLATGFFALAGVTYVLIVLGALVRAHGAGLACPDWPLCFGELIPRFDFKVAFEWGHRALAGSVGIVFLALLGLTLRRPALRMRMRAGLLGAALLLGAQVVLGGLTVLELLARWTVTSHLVTGNAFALSLVLLGRRLLRLAGGSPVDGFDAAGSPTASQATTAQRGWVSLAGALLALQVVLGGLVSSSYAGLACPDWPTCMNGEVFPTWSGVQGLHVLHRTLGYAVVVVTAIAAWAAPAACDPVTSTWTSPPSAVAAVTVASVASATPSPCGSASTSAVIRRLPGL